MKTVAIILAAGQGKRMNSSLQKQFILLQGYPVLYYSLKTFQESCIDEIILVTGQGEEAFCKTEMVDKYQFTKVTKIVAGGKERYHSVYQGLSSIDHADFVFIHDGARPLVTGDIIDRGFEKVKETKACVAAVPVIDTIKIVNKEGIVESTPDRSKLFSMQTPQVFDFSLIKKGYENLITEEEFFLKKGIPITDDAMAVEMTMNQSVQIFEGSYENIKITTAGDLALADMLLNRVK